MFSSFLRSFVSSAVVASFFSLAGCATSGPASVVGQQAPRASFTRAEGGDFRVEDHRGDVVVLAFFTSYCPTSAATLRAVDRLRARNAGAGLAVVAVNEGDTSSQIEDMLGKLGVRLPVALDKEGSAAKELGLRAVPSIVVIDRQGTVRHVHAGYHGEVDRSAIEREVSALLGESAPAGVEVTEDATRLAGTFTPPND